MENRITEREQMIKNAVIIDESELSVDNVSVGTHVTLLMTGEDENEEYDIVGRTLSLINIYRRSGKAGERQDRRHPVRR